jgi:KRAB domain-containing zinc finger protein
MVYLDLDLDLDLSKALIMFMCLVFKLKSTTLSGLPTNDILSRYKDQIESLQTQDVYLFTQVYKYVMRLCNQNPDLDTFHDLVPGKIVSDFDTLPDLPTLIASSRKIENMRNNALNLGAFPILASALRAATPSAAPHSTAGSSTAVLNTNTNRKLTDKKPHVCQFCGYISPNPSNLKRHIRTHTGERPYSCPDCNYKANQSSDLKRHMITHTDEKPFQCQFCVYRANTLSNLRSHHKRCKYKHD